MTKSEVALKIMGIIAKNAGNYTVKCISSLDTINVFYVTIYDDIISFTDSELRIESGNGYIRCSFSDIRSIHVYNSYTVIHFENGGMYSLTYKGGK